MFDRPWGIGASAREGIPVPWETPVMGESTSLLLAVCGAVAVISVGCMLFCVIRSDRGIRAYQKELAARAWPLRIHRMLGHLGVSLSHYLRKASSMEVEKHLIVCSRCETTDVCDEYLAQEGKGMDVETFCPNALQLMKYRHRSNHVSQGDVLASEGVIGPDRHPA